VKTYGVAWKIIATNHDQQTFRTVLKSPSIAARVYDRYAIQKNGLRAQTNFSYRRQDLI